MPTRTPSFQEVLAAAAEAKLEDVRVCIPGRVESYDGSRQKADVQPLIKRQHFDEYGDSVVEAPPVVPGVPVVFPGGGGFVVQFPISVGDTGLLVFPADSIDKWLDQGGLVDPESHHRFSLSDAVFLPGLRPFSSPRAQAPASLILGADGGVQVQVGQAEIKLGPVAVDAVVKGTTYRVAEDVMLGLIATALSALAAEPTLSASKAATGAAATGIGTFLLTAATYLSTLVKTQ